MNKSDAFYILLTVAGLSAPARSQDALGRPAADPYSFSSPANSSQTSGPDFPFGSMGSYGYGGESDTNPGRSDATPAPGSSETFDRYGNYSDGSALYSDVPGGVLNPYGRYGEPYGANNSRNSYGGYSNPYGDRYDSDPYATDAPGGYNQYGDHFRGSASNPYGAYSASNPDGDYGSPYSRPPSARSPAAASSKVQDQNSGFGAELNLDPFPGAADPFGNQSLTSTPKIDNLNSVNGGGMNSSLSDADTKPVDLGIHPSLPAASSNSLSTSPNP